MPLTVQHASGQYLLSYGSLITLAVAGQQLRDSVSTGKVLDSAHCGRLEATPIPWMQ